MPKSPVPIKAAADFCIPLDFVYSLYHDFCISKISLFLKTFLFRITVTFYHIPLLIMASVTTSTTQARLPKVKRAYTKKDSTTVKDAAVSKTSAKVRGTTTKKTTPAANDDTTKPKRSYTKRKSTKDELFSTETLPTTNNKKRSVNDEPKTTTQSNKRLRQDQDPSWVQMCEQQAKSKMLEYETPRNFPERKSNSRADCWVQLGPLGKRFPGNLKTLVRESYDMRMLLDSTTGEFAKSKLETDLKTNLPVLVMDIEDGIPDTCLDWSLQLLQQGKSFHCQNAEDAYPCQRFRWFPTCKTQYSRLLASFDLLNLGFQLRCPNIQRAAITWYKFARQDLWAELLANETKQLQDYTAAYDTLDGYTAYDETELGIREIKRMDGTVGVAIQAMRNYNDKNLYAARVSRLDEIVFESKAVFEFYARPRLSDFVEDDFSDTDSDTDSDDDERVSADDRLKGQILERTETCMLVWGDNDTDDEEEEREESEEFSDDNRVVKSTQERIDSFDDECVVQSIETSDEEYLC